MFIFIIALYILEILAAIILITWAICKRKKEKKIEKEKFKDYDNY